VGLYSVELAADSLAGESTEVPGESLLTDSCRSIPSPACISVVVDVLGLPWTRPTLNDSVPLPTCCPMSHSLSPRRMTL